LDDILARTDGLWEEMRGRRLFLTGATGFFGSWLLESFARANDRLGLAASAVVLTRRPESVAAAAPHLAGRRDISWIAGDIRSFAFPAGGFDYAIHAAAESGSRAQDTPPSATFDIITLGSRRLIEFAGKAGFQKILFTSSGAVYGPQTGQAAGLREDHTGGPDPLNPASAYGESKRAAELLLVLHGANLGYEAKIARCFAFVGPRLPLDAHFAIGNFIRDALRGGPVAVQGDGTPVRSYLYAADLTVWLWTILHKGANCRAYNVGSGWGRPIGDWARLTAQVLAPGAAVTFARPPDPSRPPERYVPDVGRAHRELSLAEWTEPAEALRKTAAWSKSAGLV
jgi:dTDP-glucose 4,6-dehydratase